ncbi:MAG: DNA (cytosine-5-)-methyltransferase [Treponema sp.]|nr:DNA (cytosine-5-)-methyltransferase [Treponema sp.]
MDLFSEEIKEYKIKKQIRLIELFGGIGSQAMALRDIGADFEHYRLVEFDKYPVASYNAIHGTDFKPTDITKIHGSDLGIVDTDMYTYLMTYSFPCQDLSNAGKMRGMKKGSGTRSGLLWEVERLLTETENLPQVLLMENVPQVIGTKNIADFTDWKNFLKDKGYQNFVQILNAKDYGIAQNRRRCFMVSILSDELINFEFPKPIPLTTVVKDYLEEEVEEKYYINNEKAKKLIEDLIEREVIAETECTKLLTSRQVEAENCQSVLQSAQDTTQESASTSAKELECVNMNYRRIDKRNCEVAKTLCARDYKGFGTGFDTMNGVIEWIKN